MQNTPAVKSREQYTTNRFPLWKQCFIWLVIILGGLYALPNIYTDLPALQIASNDSVTDVDQSLNRRVQSLLESRGIQVVESRLQQQTNRTTLQVAFANVDVQLQAQELLLKALGDNYVVALNSAETTPQWLRTVNAKAMKLGLDLLGGVHFLLEVDVSEALRQRLEQVFGQMRTLLRRERLRFVNIEIIRPNNNQQHGVDVFFASNTVRERALPLIEREYADRFLVESRGDDIVRLLLSDERLKEIETTAIQQNLITLRNRVNELGVAEPLVQRQGRNRIVVELPGVQDTATAKRIIGATANLEFRLETEPATPASQSVVLPFRSRAGTARLEKDIIATGQNVVHAQSTFDENGRPQVNIELDGVGGDAMTVTTRNNLKRGMAVVFIEYKNKTKIETVDGKRTEIRVPQVNKDIISLASIEGVFANRFRITGLRNQLESSELALLLRAGSLAAPVYFVEERSVGPSLGEENIRQGINSLLLGMLLVLAFMILYYRVFGVVAVFCLMVNLVLLIAVMSVISATLTLPGIAGIVLTVGMVVDANVIIFSRIREELKLNRSPMLAIDSGFSRALVAILDANITTLLVAVILFAIGTGPIKGFAITLSVGIVASLFCSVYLARYLITLLIGRRRQLHRLLFIQT